MTNLKNGITISILAITIAVMFILVTTATVIGSASINSVMYEEYISKLKRVATDINIYYNKNADLPITGEVVTTDSLNNEINQEVLNNNDSLEEFYVVDMQQLKSYSVNIGYGTKDSSDIFVVTNNSHNIYYLKGFRYKGVTYYSVK